MRKIERKKEGDDRGGINERIVMEKNKAIWEREREKRGRKQAQNNIEKKHC